MIQQMGQYESRTSVQVTTTATAQGDTLQPTADDLKAFLAAVPGDARVTVRHTDDQREGAHWRAEAKWTGTPRPAPVYREPVARNAGESS